MLWPHRVLARRDSEQDRRASEVLEERFVPPRCPNLDCDSARTGFEWIHWGWHARRKAPHRVRRFRCLTCRRTFSTQTFRFSYWQKCPELDSRVRISGLSCSANRQIAGIVGCNKETVAHKLERLGRHSLRFQHRELAARGKRLKGTLLFDGLGSFEQSQFFPYWLNVAVHAESSFALAFTDSPLRRSGTMTRRQRRVREALEARFGRPPRTSIIDGTAELLESVRRYLDDSATVLRSDEHPAYPVAIRKAGLAHLPHRVTAGRNARTRSNPLFEINLSDLILRHTGSHLKRETIAFNRRRQAGLEKAAMWAVHRNFMQPRRARWKRTDPTPAMLVGIANKPLTFEEIYDRRVFPDEVTLSAAHRRQERREVRTVVLSGRDRLHVKRYAY